MMTWEELEGTTLRTRDMQEKPELPDMSDINGLDDDLFDMSSDGYGNSRGLQLSPSLSALERRQASQLYHMFNELWGLCIVCGPPGAGKDTFLNWFLYTCKKFFPQKRILRDEKPYPLFGKYAGLFNEARIKADLEQMRKVAIGSNGETEQDNRAESRLEKSADKWAKSDRAKVLLQDSIVGLTEYWKYVQTLNFMAPINKTMGAIHKMARHFNTLVIGCAQLESDLSRKTCKPFVNWRVSCSRSHVDTTRYSFLVQRVAYDHYRDRLTPVGRFQSIPVDAGKPRSDIGDGKIVIRNRNYTPQTPEEYIVIEAIKAGINDYKTLVAFLDAEGDISEMDTLLTLKDLCLKLPGKRPKFAIWYPCIYHIFNSQSAPNLTTRLKAEE
jgi:hypothetical protein